MTILRQRAEEIVRNQSEDSSNLSLPDAQHLLHELQVHQIELEMQNDELRKANEQCSILQNKYADLYNFAPTGYCTLDLNGHLLEANFTLAEQLDVAKDHLINTPFYHYIVKEDRDLLYLHLKKLYQTEVQTNCEVKLVKQNGCQFHAQLESRFVRNSVDNSSVIHTSIMDITEQKKTEQALQASEEKYRSLVDNINVGIFRFSVDGKILNVNRALVRMLGFDSAEELMLLPAIVNYVDIKRREELLAKLREQGKVKNFEVEGLRKEGTTFYASVSSILKYDDKGNPLFMDGVIEEITERKQAEELLRQERDKAQTYLDIAGVMFVALDSESKVTLINLKGYDILGYSEAEIIGQNWFDNFIPARHKTEVQEVFAKLMRGDMTSIEYYENSILTQSGEERIIAWHNAIVRDKNGNITGILASGEDITERRQIEMELAEERASLAQKVEERTTELSLANAELARGARLKDEFLANMSHELRTPLNAILMISELLTNAIYGEINAEQLKAIGQIETGGRHLLSLITDILDLSTIEAGKMKLEPENIIVEGVCRAGLQIVKQIALKKQVSVLFTFDENVITLFADERALKQILVNLLNNAIKFTARKGKVILELQGDKVNGVANINVIDTGIGIPEHELDNLFKPFVQIDSGLNRQHEGSGLGLALVYKLTKLQGGSVHVKSEIGKGSIFTVSLPWQESDKVPSLQDDDDITTVKQDFKVRHTGAVVLVAEDNEANIVTIETALTLYGYKVIVTRDGLETIERTREIKPAIILMDIQMPGMDGLEATTQIRADADEQLAKTPIIALTALAMSGDKKRCLDAGANVYLSKPVNIKRLVKEIETLLS